MSAQRGHFEPPQLDIDEFDRPPVPPPSPEDRMTAHQGHFERAVVKRCPACRKGYKTDAGYERHVSTHADDSGRPICNCLLPVELMGYRHQLACPVTWMEPSR